MERVGLTPSKLNDTTERPSKELLSALELNMAASYAGWGRAAPAELYEGPDLTRVITGIPYPLFNGVFGTRLSPKGVDRAIEAAAARFAARRVPALWWVGPASKPDDLGTHLERHGFVHVGEVPGMAVDLETLEEGRPAPAGLSIERVEDEETMRTWARVAWDGTGFPEAGREAFVHLVASLGSASDLSQVCYLGVLDGVPVATSALVTHAGVAGIYAVATLPEARRKGIGAALTLAPLRDAREIGYRVGTLQASAMGFPVYRSLGFRQVCAIGQYRWAG